MIAIVFACIASASALIGGVTAFLNRERLHRLLGLTAGIVLGAIAFDLMPEIYSLAGEIQLDPTWPMVALVSGFLLVHSIEKLVAIHYEHDEYKGHRHPNVGVVSASALVGHSLLDGVGIGLAFQAGLQVGLAVAVAVIAHRFADGLNTVSLMLSHNNNARRTKMLLLATSAAPIAGALATLFFTPGAAVLSLCLGFFAGSFLYIGASDILPEAHSKHPSRLTLLLTILGTLGMFLVTRVVVE